MSYKDEIKIVKLFYNNHRKKYFPYLIYNLIVGMYIYFYKISSLKIKKAETPKAKKIIINSNKIESKLSKIESIYMNDRRFNLILISSYADSKYTESSDVDMIVLLNELTFKSFLDFINVKIKLDKLTVFYQKIDPTQHHGNWIFHEKEFLNYDESIMPMCVLDNSISIQRKTEIFYIENRVELKKEIKKMFLIHIQNGRILCKKMFENKINLYELKDFISIISLLVPMLFQIEGKMFRKEEAIEKWFLVLDQKSFKTLNFSTKLRDNWKMLNKKGLYKFIRTLSLVSFERSLLNYISKKYPAKYNVEEIKKITENEMISFDEVIYYFDFIERKVNEIRS